MEKYKNHIIASLYCLIISGLIWLTVAPNNGGTILVGGGDFPRQAVEWAYEHSTGGYFLVITCNYINEQSWAKRLDGYEYKSIILHTRNDSYLEANIERVKRAAVIIIDGGNQWDYVSLLKGTPLNKAINQAIENKTPIAGISAGCALLGEFYFSAKDGTICSEDIYNKPPLNLQSNFFNIAQLRNIFVETHYVERDREGRLLAFLSELSLVYKKEITGIGVDRSTALCINTNGKRTIYGEGQIYQINFKKTLDKPRP